MRATSVLRVLLALKHTRVLGFEFDDDGLVVDVAPTWKLPRCATCKKVVHSGYDARERRWRHLDMGGIKVLLRYSLRRVECDTCGVVVEHVPWAESASRFTLPMEGHIAYHAQRTDRTTVTKLLRIAWRTVGTVVQRFIRRHEDRAGDPLEGLRIIGVDELSYRRHHEYVTTVVDHERGIVVWAGEGKSAETLNAFFKALGPDRTAKLEAVTIDMSGAYIKAVSEASPQAQIIFDRFHVQRLAHEAVDEVRREEVRKAKAADKPALKRTRWALQKNPWNLTRFEQDKLANLERINAPIYRAYLLKESLRAILDSKQINVARRKLDEWLAWARDSMLAPFIKLAKTIDQHRDGILAYVRTRLNNGRIEGTNGKARVITRRSFGLHSAAALIAMLFLCCGGITAYPSHVYPFDTH